MLVIKPVEEIIKEFLPSKKSIRNFPKVVQFPFDELYSKIVPQIRTTELSSECILFDSIEAYNENVEFSNVDYWSENSSRNEIEQFWIFGQNGQGDRWILDNKNKVYFYDHSKGLLCKHNFIQLDIDFKKWLQFANLNKQFDEIYDKVTKMDDKQISEYKEKLNELSTTLLINYPFEI